MKALSIYQLKGRFQAILRPSVHFLARNKVKPNTVTILGLLLSISTGIFLWMGGSYFILPVVLFFRMALNAIDGMLAREHQMMTQTGAVLNELSDVISDIALYLPLMKVPGFHSEWVALFLSFSVISEFSGILMNTLGSERRYDGPFGKSDRAVLFGALGIILGFEISLAQWTLIGIESLCMLLLFWTIWNRIINGLQSAKI